MKSPPKCPPNVGVCAAIVCHSHSDGGCLRAKFGVSKENRVIILSCHVKKSRRKDAGALRPGFCEISPKVLTATSLLYHSLTYAGERSCKVVSAKISSLITLLDALQLPA